MNIINIQFSCTISKKVLYSYKSKSDSILNREKELAIYKTIKQALPRLISGQQVTLVLQLHETETNTFGDAAILITVEGVLL